MTQPRTRRATPNDARAIAALLTHLGYPAEPHDIPARLEAMDSPDNVVFVTTGDDGDSVGLVAVHVLPTLHANARVAIVMALVVAPKARGRGVGRELVRAAEAWAVDRRCERLMVTSAEHRADAHAFYPSCGMPYTGRRFAKMLPASGNIAATERTGQQPPQ